MGGMPTHWVIGLGGEGWIACFEGTPWNGKAVACPSFPGYLLLESFAKTRLVVDTKLETEAGGRRWREDVIGHQIRLELVVDTCLIREPTCQ